MDPTGVVQKARTMPAAGIEAHPEGPQLEVARPHVADRPADPLGVLFFCVNGAGLGHLTRSLAIARRLHKQAPNVPLRFLTSSKAFDVIEREGIAADYIPPARSADRVIPPDEWNAMLRAQLATIRDQHGPRVLVYDGVFPYSGLLKAITEGGFEHAAMVLRLRHKNDTLRAKAKSLGCFERLIFPGEAGTSDPEASLPAELRQLPHQFVDPIVFLDPDELLSRDVARAELKLDSARRVVYVQLGAGNINNIRKWVDCILDTLRQRDNVDIVLAESLIANEPHAAHDRVRILRQYPNSRYFNAFDLAITAVGYNTFHELMHFGVPSVLVPNQETHTDDQVQRAMVAHHAQAAKAVLEPEELAEAIDAALATEVAQTMREKSKSLVPANGASAVARYLQSLALGTTQDTAAEQPAGVLTE